MGHAITPSAGAPKAKISAATQPRSQHRDNLSPPAPDCVTELAMRIADHAVRSDIECYAHSFTTHGFDWFNLTQPSDRGDGYSEADRAHDLQVIANAVRYIEMRGDVFEWRLIHSVGDRSIVRFEMKP